MEIAFYHLRKTTILAELPRFIAKIYSMGERLSVLCNNNIQMQDLDKVLWTTPANAFVPHDVSTCLNPEKQPVLLYSKENNDNTPDVLLNRTSIFIDLTMGNVTKQLDLKKYLYFFYGNDDDNSVKTAHDLYKHYASHKQKAIFWKQDDSLRWIQQ